MENTIEKLIDARTCCDEYIALFEQYCKELLTIDASMAQYDFAKLAEENLESDTDHPYLIELDGEFVGLVVTMDEEEPEEGACHTYLGELFVLPAYRGRGIASRIAREYLAAQTHDVGLCYVRGSAAERFWLKRMTEWGYAYKVFEEDDVRDFLYIRVSVRE